MGGMVLLRVSVEITIGRLGAGMPGPLKALKQMPKVKATLACSVLDMSTINTLPLSSCWYLYPRGALYSRNLLNFFIDTFVPIRKGKLHLLHVNIGYLEIICVITTYLSSSI